MLTNGMTSTKSHIREDADELTRLRIKILKDAQQRYGPLFMPKLDVLDFAFRRFGVSSFADLGAAYRVDGGYSFYVLDSCAVTRAVLVDAQPTERMLAEAAARKGAEVVRGYFGDSSIAEKVGKVDAVVLFDVLLHQVQPDWDEVIALYAPRTRLFVIHNPQWLGPKTLRLLDLGGEKYLSVVPKIRNEAVYQAAIYRPDEINPARGRRNRDVYYIWQWGITDIDLVSRMHALGFALRYFQDHGYFWDLENFRNHSFIFEKTV